jgi:putative N6-adenine-specific DNA methylase
MIKMIATCPEETKDTLVKELDFLGCTSIKEGFRNVAFTVTEAQYYEVHLKLRTASGLMVVVKECAAKHKSMLFNQAKRINWHEYFSPQSTFMVEGIPGDRGEGVMDGTKISMAVREAIQDSFQYNGHEAPKTDVKNPDVKVICFVKDDKASISLDTSGKSLHKRGYKDGRHPAPIKETLAASILSWADYDGTFPLLDPMCGSGTIAIEGAYIALNKAPLIHRKKGEFAFEKLLTFDKNLWRETQERCRSERLEKPFEPIFASDISSEYVAMAADNALRARVEKHIGFEQASFFDLKKPTPKGLLVTNLPYGERLDPNESELKEFYKNIGNKLKRDFAGWRAFLLCLEDSPHKFIGLKPSFKRTVLNGSLRVKILGFDLYDGTRKGG